jgi:AcrR family transcriptional regulator
MANGRPREFDIELALDRAMELFWRKGYEGTSLSDLTDTLGITRPSLYAAFGNKEALFRRALERYETNVVTYRQKALNATSAHDVARELLVGAANVFGDKKTPAGCLNVQSALACSDEAEPIRQELIANRDAGERALRQRLKRAQAEGDLPEGSDPASLARFLSSVVYGMAVLSAGGANRKELLEVAEMSLRMMSASHEI